MSKRFWDDCLAMENDLVFCVQTFIDRDDRARASTLDDMVLRLKFWREALSINGAAKPMIEGKDDEFLALLADLLSTIRGLVSEVQKIGLEDDMSDKLKDDMSDRVEDNRSKRLDSKIALLQRSNSLLCEQVEVFESITWMHGEDELTEHTKIVSISRSRMKQFADNASHGEKSKAKEQLEGQPEPRERPERDKSDERFGEEYLGPIPWSDRAQEASEQLEEKGFQPERLPERRRKVHESPESRPQVPAGPHEESQTASHDKAGTGHSGRDVTVFGGLLRALAGKASSIRNTSSSPLVLVENAPATSLITSHSLYGSGLTKNAAFSELARLSFIVQVKELSISPGLHRRPYNLWWPPLQKARFSEMDASVFRWRGGAMKLLEGANRPEVSGLQRHRSITMFTQYPDSDLLLTLNDDATQRDASANEWRNLCFEHKYMNGGYLSKVQFEGSEQRLAGPSHEGLQQLIPSCYRYAMNNPPRRHDGMTGDLAFLIALAAFSAPSEKTKSVLLHLMMKHRWLKHPYADGRQKERRGLVVTIYLDPENANNSTKVKLRKLENGDYGPFYS